MLEAHQQHNKVCYGFNVFNVRDLLAGYHRVISIWKDTTPASPSALPEDRELISSSHKINLCKTSQALPGAPILAFTCIQQEVQSGLNSAGGVSLIFNFL